MEERSEEQDEGRYIYVDVYPQSRLEGKSFSISKGVLGDGTWNRALISTSAMGMRCDGLRDMLAAGTRALEIAAQLDALHPEGSKYTPKLHPDNLRVESFATGGAKVCESPSARSECTEGPGWC